MGVEEAEFYDAARVAIVPMGFCFPGLDTKGGDLPPRRECAEQWRGKVFAAMPQLELLLLVGTHAQRWHLGDRVLPTLTETVAAWRAIRNSSKQQRMLPLPHPSWRNNRWLADNPWFEAELLPALRRDVRKLL